MKTLIYFYLIIFINTIIAEEELPLGIERSDIGIDDLIKMASNQFPVPSVTPVGEIKVKYFDHSTCSNDSVIEDMVMSKSFPLKFTCNGQQVYQYKTPFYFDIKMRENGETSRLTLPSTTVMVKYLKGNLIYTVTGTIDAPAQCKGDYYWVISLIVAKSQYQCLSIGVTGHTMVYSFKQIIGKCQSTCWYLTGNTTLDPPVNNLALVNKN